MLLLRVRRDDADDGIQAVLVRLVASVVLCDGNTQDSDDKGSDKPSAKMKHQRETMVVVVVVVVELSIRSNNVNKEQSWSFGCGTTNFKQQHAAVSCHVCSISQTIQYRIAHT